jgi:glycosyltransferase involved in cell wall biosynthesis
MPHDSDPAGTMISADPPVVHVVHEPGRPLAAAQAVALCGRKALFLLTLGTTIEVEDAASEFASDLKTALADRPNVKVVVLTDTNFEAYLLADHGISAMPASRSIFVDETVFKPWDGPVEFDAVYNARLTLANRHELARDVTRLALIYDRDRPNNPNRLDEVKIELPRATFVNHVEGQGAYRHLLPEECDRHINRARVGLSLSRTGATITAMEYMLAGLPIVSTQSRGGRERYLLPPFCRLVDDNPAAIADAVDMFARRPIPKSLIRSHALQMLQFERYNVLIAVNNLARELFGIETLFPTFASFQIGLTRPNDRRTPALERVAS